MKLYSTISNFTLKTIKKIIDWVKNNKKSALFFLIIFTLWVSIIAFGSKRYADESYHYRQIKIFHAHKFEMANGLTTIPGYHLIISTIARASNDTSFFKTRIISLFLSLAIIVPTFFQLVKRDNFDNSMRNLSILMLMPIAFIYYPLVYTDVFSASLVFLSFYLSLKKKYHWAALISILSICVRQQNIVWHLFIWTYFYFSLYGFSFYFKNIFNYLRSTFGFFIGLVLFFVFVKLNGGIAIGDKNSHQMGIYMGNIYFFLFLAGVLFWPLLIKRLLVWKELVKNKFTWIALISASMLSILLFFYTPTLHGYNNDPRFIRNIFLTFMYNGHLIFYATLVFIGTLSLFSISFYKSKNYLIYLFTVLCLLPSWLIEQRYTIIPFLFILLFKKEEDHKIEKFMQLYFLILSTLLTVLIIKTKLFL